MKKIWIGLIVCMFIVSSLPGIIGDMETNEHTFEAREFIENRDIIPVYTEHGLERAPGAKGKPGVTVIITAPDDGATVSGTVDITINSNNNPTIKIDGVAVGTGLLYVWDTTAYSDGSHIIIATAKGVTDSHTVTVNNNGGNTPPVVTVTNPNNGATVSGTVTITVDATDAEDGTLTADIYIDDSHVANANSYSWVTTGYADGSSHTIRVDVEDTGGLTDSDSITVTVNNGGGNVKKYALVIGISDYEGTANDLEYCDDDAVDWKNFLQGEGYSVTMLTDKQATAGNIEDALYALIDAEDGDDYVVLTYSGHGAKYRNYGSCIISQDLYYMTHGYFESFFDMAESQHIYFAFDACQIGGFQGLMDTNRVGAFASNSKYSYDGDGSMKNGVFTYYQMDGWNNQQFDNFEEDSAYAVQGMNDWASQYANVNVDPFYTDNYAGPMVP